MRALWNGIKLITALRARVNGAFPPAVSGISIDTRTLAAGDLFFAIKGENSDGHDFVRAALDKGAAAAVVDEDHAEALRGAGPQYIVRDVLASLESLGRESRARSSAGIVAVTGSVGKTGTKEMLKLALSQHGETHASAASYNNHWGVPLTLARMHEDTRFGVFEIGMNHAGEITGLVDMVRPHVAIVTTIAPVHLAQFASVDDIARAKAEIFSGLEPNGLAIVHRDIEQFELLRAAAREREGVQVLSFGDHEQADARLVSVQPEGTGSRVEAWILGQTLQYRIGAPGRHMATNSLAVLLAGRALGVDPFFVAAGLADFSPPPGRGVRAPLQAKDGAFTLIDESYNANPTSMRAALSLLQTSQPGKGGRRIAVIGDMLELGPRGEELHRELAPVVAESADLLYGAGPLTSALFVATDAERRGKWGENSAAIAQALCEDVRAGDVVMIKGSNGSRMALLVKALKDASEAVQAARENQTAEAREQD